MPDDGAPPRGALSQPGAPPSCGGERPPAGARIWLKGDHGVRLVDGRVAEWANLAEPGAPPARQDDPGRRPTLAPNVVNGRAVVRLDGDDDFLVIRHPVQAKVNMSIAVVTATREFQAGISGGVELGNSGTSNCALLWKETVMNSAVLLCTAQREVSFRYGVGRAHEGMKFKHRRPQPQGGKTFTLTMSTLAGPSRKLYVDGRFVTEVIAPGTGAIAPVTEDAWIGRSMFGDGCWPGDVAEVLVYDRTLDEDEQRALERYLRCEYALPEAP